MNQGFDPSLLPVVLLVWPITKSLVFMVAAVVNLWSRKPTRRAEARRMMRMIHRTDTDRNER
jgi:hypothetical protein